MQQPDDRQQGPRRPSLFTEEAATPAEDAGILSQLDGKNTTPVRPSTRPRKTGKLVAGALGLGVVAGGLVWAFGYNSNEPGLLDVPAGAQLATAQPVPTQTLAVAPPSTAQARGTEVASIERTVISDEREVSAATILDNTTAGDSPGRPAEALAHALEGPARHDEKDELTAAFDRPTEPAKGGHATKPHDKGGAKDKHKADSARAAHATHVAHAAKKRTAHGAASAADSDVALLEALISHTRPSGKAGAAKTPVRATRCAPAEGDDEHGAHRSAECRSPVVKAAG